jgi:hypothetical protein
VGFGAVECSFAAPEALVGLPTVVEGGAGVDLTRKKSIVAVTMAERCRWKGLLFCFDCGILSACGTQRFL